MLPLVGLVLIGIALRDVVHELFHPELAGSISRFVSERTWQLLRALARLHRSVLHHAGPMILIAVGTAWLALLAIGAALIYMPELPQGFDVSRSLPEAAQRGFGTALYLSMAIMTSVGSGDISPESSTVRAVAALEPVVGLVLISAWITWVLSIYPIIAQRRSFSREVDFLRRAEPDPSALPRDAPREAVPELLRALTTQLVRVTSDLAQTRITYYFHNEAQHLSLGSQLPYVLALGRAAEAFEREPLIRHYGSRLRMAVEDLLNDVGVHHLHISQGTPEQILDALARDQLLDENVSSRPEPPALAAPRAHAR